MESHIISTTESFTHSNLRTVSPPQPVSQLEHMIPPQTESPTILTGESVSNQILIPSELVSQSKNETSFVKPSVSLLSNVKPHAILEKVPKEPRILRVSKEDVDALCQVIAEFQEQISGF
jgi:hypothetical protein